MKDVSRHSLARAYRRMTASGAVTLIGLVAAMLVQGGWQAVAAAVASAAGIGFALNFGVIAALADRSRTHLPLRQPVEVHAPAG